MTEMKNVDDLIVQACREHKESLAPFGPDFARIEKEALSKLHRRVVKRRRALTLRIAAAVLVALVGVNGFLLFAEIGPVKAYQAEMRRLVSNLFNNEKNGETEALLTRTATEVERVQKLVPFTIPVPSWIPEGYQFDNITMTNDGEDIYHVVLRYAGSADQLVVNISNDTSISSTFPSPDEETWEKLNVNGYDIFLHTFERAGIVRYNCTYFNYQGLHVYISCSIDKQSLIRFITSLK